LLVVAPAVGAADPVKPQAPIAAEKAKAGVAPAGAAPSIDVLNVGDRVRVVFSDIPQQVPPLEMQIPDNGELTLHLGHKFMFKGKRRDVLEQEIRDFYKDSGIYRIINVTIEVPPRPISVGGEVRAPGNYPHNGRMTVLKAIDMAGGFTDYSNRRKVTVIRDGKTIIVNCNKAVDDPEKYDREVFPGDKIQVKRSIW
jgi:polysaccharide export outer membrane protein